MRLRLEFGLLFVLACGPGKTAGSGGDSDGTDGTGTATATGSTGDGGTSMGTGAGTTGADDCPVGDAQVEVTFFPGDWPSEAGAERGDVDYDIEAACTVGAIASLGVGFDMAVSCLDGGGQSHDLALEAILNPGGMPPLAVGDPVQLRFVRDTWWDVTRKGKGEWLSVSKDGALLFASMSGDAEFLGFDPNEHAGWWSPIELDYGGSCGEGRQAVDAALADTHVIVPDGGHDDLVTVDGNYTIIVGQMTSQDQGPEYPSVSTRALAALAGS